VWHRCGSTASEGFTARGRGQVLNKPLTLETRQGALLEGPIQVSAPVGCAGTGGRVQGPFQPSRRTLRRLEP